MDRLEVTVNMIKVQSQPEILSKLDMLKASSQDPTQTNFPITAGLGVLE
jgi:hypothetical protein